MVKSKKFLKYPWLNYFYKKIIDLWSLKYFNYNLIISYSSELKVNILVLELIKWIICVKKYNYISCNNCLNCNLLNIYNHPDIYIIKNYKNIINLCEIEFMKKKLFVDSYLSEYKIIYFPRTKFLNMFTFNSLLKLMEEPPFKTIFIFSCLNNINIPPTILSRCYLYRLSSPKEYYLLILINKKISFYDKKSIISAIRLSNKSPIISYYYLRKLWKKRLFFLNKFYISISDDIDCLIKLINDKFLNFKLYWLSTLFIDIVKYNLGDYINIINIDMFDIIIFFYKRININNIFLILKKIFLLMNELVKSININRNILITDLVFLINLNL